MRTREPAIGWCGNIPEVIRTGAAHWPGRLIYKAGREFETSDGRKIQTTLALCPSCGLWVDVRPDDSIPAHELPGGGNANRAAKRRKAEHMYGALVVADRLRRVDAVA